MKCKPTLDFELIPVFDQVTGRLIAHGWAVKKNNHKTPDPAYRWIFDYKPNQILTCWRGFLECWADQK